MAADGSRSSNVAFPALEWQNSHQARISALRQLVAQVPPPVIADALGIHPTTATRQAVNLGTTWSRYASIDRHG